jgi:hypothetical protein
MPTLSHASWSAPLPPCLYIVSLPLTMSLSLCVVSLSSHEALVLTVATHLHWRRRQRARRRTTFHRMRGRRRSIHVRRGRSIHVQSVDCRVTQPTARVERANQGHARRVKLCLQRIIQRTSKRGTQRIYTDTIYSSRCTVIGTSAP